MTSNVTIELLRKVFCNFGIPDVVVSDNDESFFLGKIELIT